MSRTEIIDNLTALVTQVGMNVAIVNPSIGLLEARNEIQVSFWGTTTSDVWSFNVRNDSIFAYAKTLSYDKNGLVETEEYRTDETTSRSSHWYWDVRNGIEAMCEGTTIVFVKTN